MDEMEIKSGFTRIEAIGQRRGDKAKMAMIELVGNPISKWEEQQDMQDAQDLGRDTYW